MRSRPDRPNPVGSPTRPCLIVGLVLLASIGARGADAELSPGLPPLPEIGVPPLHEVRPEHHLSGDGLVLVPEAGPYEWTQTGPTKNPFKLRVGVGAGRFDHGILTVWNWHNHAVKQWRIGAGEERTLDIRIAGLGVYLVTFDGWRDGAWQERLIRNIGATADQNAARESWRKDEFFVGLCAFPGRYHWKPGDQPALPAGLTESEARQREAALIARTGLQVVRTDESLEMGRQRTPEGGETYHFDFSRMDAAVASYTDLGFQLVLQTMSAADWAVLPQYADKGKDRWRYPHREAPQRAYLAALVERYGHHARFVQVSNEPDQIGYWTGTNDEFVAQYTYSRDEIRRVAPGLPVTTGGYSLVDEAKCAYFIDRLHPLVDLPAYNAHGNLADYKRSFATMLRFQAAAGDTREGWVNTETGYSAWRLEQERRQAQIDAQKILYSWANDHRGVLLFCSRMTRPPGRDGTPDFGLLDYQYCPRFVYGTVSALVGALDGASFHETLAESEDIHLYLFRREGELVLAGFTLGEGAATATLDHDAQTVTALDEMGNAQPLADTGPLTVALDGYPRYWVLRGAKQVRRVR